MSHGHWGWLYLRKGPVLLLYFHVRGLIKLKKLNDKITPFLLADTSPFNEEGSQWATMAEDKCRPDCSVISVSSFQNCSGFAHELLWGAMFILKICCFFFFFFFFFSFIFFFGNLFVEMYRGSYFLAEWLLDKVGFYEHIVIKI